MPLKNAKLGRNVKIPYPELVNLYGCRIGDDCFIGPFVEIQSDVTIGTGCRIQSHSFICTKVRIGDRVFIGHGVMFSNDRYPVRTDPGDWEETVIGDGAVLGNNVTLLPCRVGKGALIGAGAVVTQDIPPDKVAVGSPARVIGDRKQPAGGRQ